MNYISCEEQAENSATAIKLYNDEVKRLNRDRRELTLIDHSTSEKSDLVKLAANAYKVGWDELAKQACLGLGLEFIGLCKRIAIIDNTPYADGKLLKVNQCFYLEGQEENGMYIYDGVDIVHMSSEATENIDELTGYHTRVIAQAAATIDGIEIGVGETILFLGSNEGAQGIYQCNGSIFIMQEQDLPTVNFPNEPIKMKSVWEYTWSDETDNCFEALPRFNICYGYKSSTATITGDTSWPIGQTEYHPVESKFKSAAIMFNNKNIQE